MKCKSFHVYLSNAYPPMGTYRQYLGLTTRLLPTFEFTAVDESFSTRSRACCVRAPRRFPAPDNDHSTRRAEWRDREPTGRPNSAVEKRGCIVCALAAEKRPTAAAPQRRDGDHCCAREIVAD